MWKRQTGWSVATFDALISECVVLRVFERSKLCAGHASVSDDHSGGGDPGNSGCGAADEVARPTTEKTTTAAAAETAPSAIRRLRRREPIGCSFLDSN